MRVDGERIVGSRPIIRHLDSLVAEPQLLPAPGDPSYAAVLEAERWGDEVLQAVARRIIDAALLRRPAAMESYLGDTKLPLPRALIRPGLPLTARWMARRNKARDEAARTDLAELSGHLDRIDTWIADGLLGGERPNAADLQIGSSIRLLASIGDVQPLIEGRPAAGLTRYFPPMVGEVEAGALPDEWLSGPAGG
jgi:glutathione S-transferase